jgi:pimeloyl-ACP methyl ester carboxylesterase
LTEVQRLAAYWRDGYDWRSWEARLNAHPQYTTEIDGQRIYFLHVRSPRAGAFPLILTHGWPGSVVEYLRIIEHLTAAGFHLVIPSLPGFGFSGPTREPGWGTTRTARAWAELMRRLGYDRYGAVGNDAGSMISPELGRIDGEHVSAVHVTQIFAFPSGNPAEFTDLSPADQAAMQKLQ